MEIPPWLRYVILLIPLGIVYQYVATVYILENPEITTTFNLSTITDPFKRVQRRLDDYCLRGPLEPSAENAENDTLKTVSLFIRHGFRTEMSQDNSVPNQFCDLATLYRDLLKRHGACLSATTRKAIDPFAQFTGACKPAQLTQIGVQELARLGSFLGQKYRTFLDRAKLQLKSTHYSRTVFSLAALLNSMRPNWCQEKSPVWWISNTYFAPHFLDCPVTEKLAKNETEIYTWPDYLKKVFNLTRKWSKLTHPKQVLIVAGNRHCLGEGVELPSWDEFLSYTEHVFTQYRNDSFFKRRQLLNMAPFWDDYVTKGFQDVFNIYSGHDYTIEALLSTFDYVPSEPISYGARFIVETWIRNGTERMKFIYQGVPIATMAKSEVRPNLNKKIRQLFNVDLDALTTVCQT